MPRKGSRHTIEGILMYTQEYGDIILVGGSYAPIHGGDFWTVGQLSQVWIPSDPPQKVRATGRVTAFRDMVIEEIEVVGAKLPRAAPKN